MKSLVAYVWSVFRRAAPLLAVMLAFLATAATARAEPTPEQLKKARALFQQATELEQAGNHSAALEAFREVGQVRMTPQVRYHIAVCQEKLGKLVAALGGYELALRDADSVGPAFRQDVEQSIEGLRDRIPKLVIARGDGAEAAQIELDGVALGDASIGRKVPVDPGPHAVTASAKGYRDFNQTVTVSEKETKEVQVTLEAVPSDDTVVETPPEREKPPVETPKQTWVPWVVGGAGVAALAVGGMFLLLQQNNMSDVEAYCGHKSECEMDAITANKYDNAKTYTWVARISAGVGVAAVGTAVALFVLQNKQKPAKKSDSAWSLELGAPRAQTGLSLVGQF